MAFREISMRFHVLENTKKTFRRLPCQKFYARVGRDLFVRSVYQILTGILCYHATLCRVLKWKHILHIYKFIKCTIKNLKTRICRQSPVLLTFRRRRNVRDVAPLRENEIVDGQGQSDAARPLAEAVVPSTDGPRPGPECVGRCRPRFGPDWHNGRRVRAPGVRDDYAEAKRSRLSVAAARYSYVRVDGLSNGVGDFGGAVQPSVQSGIIRRNAALIRYHQVKV